MQDEVSPIKSGINGLCLEKQRGVYDIIFS